MGVHGGYSSAGKVPGMLKAPTLISSFHEVISTREMGAVGWEIQGHLRLQESEARLYLKKFSYKFKVLDNLQKIKYITMVSSECPF